MNRKPEELRPYIAKVRSSSEGNLLDITTDAMADILVSEACELEVQLRRLLGDISLASAETRNDI